MEERIKNFYSLSLAERQKTIRQVELDLKLDFKDPNTWNEKSSEAFAARFPRYKLDFEKSVWFDDNHNYRKALINPIIYRKEQYSNGVSFDAGMPEGDSRVILKSGLGDEVYPEQPIKLKSYFRTFSYSDARIINAKGWDVSDVKYVKALFRGNKYVEEIDLSDWKYPKEARDRLLEPACFDEMFSECRNLRKLRLNIPHLVSDISSMYENIFFRDCFKGCINIEYVYFCKGSSYIKECIKEIQKVTEKELTVDGEFSYYDWTNIHGGIRFDLPWPWQQYYKDHGRAKLVEVSGVKDIKFCGKYDVQSVESEKKGIDRLYAADILDEEDYHKYKAYLATF